MLAGGSGPWPGRSAARSVGILAPYRADRPYVLASRREAQGQGVLPFARELRTRG